MNITTTRIAMIGVIALLAMTAGVAGDTLDEQMHEARQLYADGAYAEALEALEAILDEHPAHTAAHLFKGHAAFELDQSGKARRAYARAIEGGRLDAAMLGRLSQLEQQAERRGSALTALRLLLLVAPDDVAVHLSAAEACAAAGLDGEAEQLYRQVIDARPSDPMGHLRLANLHLSRERWREAIEPLTLAYHLDEADADRARTLGDLYARAKQPGAAAAWYQQAIDDGLDTSAVHLRLARTWLNVGNRERARAAAERAADASPSPEVGQALLLLGQLARDAGDDEQAMRYWQQATQQADVPAQVHVHLAGRAYEREQFGEAAQHLSQAREAGDTTPDTLRLLVLSHLGRDAPDAARQALLTYIEQHGMDEGARRLVQRIGR